MKLSLKLVIVFLSIFINIQAKEEEMLFPTGMQDLISRSHGRQFLKRLPEVLGSQEFAECDLSLIKIFGAKVSRASGLSNACWGDYSVYLLGHEEKVPVLSEEHLTKVVEFFVASIYTDLSG